MGRAMCALTPLRGAGVPMLTVVPADTAPPRHTLPSGAHHLFVAPPRPGYNVLESPAPLGAPPPRGLVMLNFFGGPHRFCDGISRRQFLRVGGLGTAGATLADLLRVESRAGAAVPARKKSVIYVVLDGGPSHIDTYDLKPDAPLEYRGDFKPIRTRLTGVQICEHMPLQAQIMDRLALLRGVRSVENDHFLSEVYTGLPRSAGHRPAFGSAVSRLAGTGSALPAYVSLNRPSSEQSEFEKPYYAGAGHAPFRPFGDALDNMRPVASLDRLRDRKQLLAAFDGLRRDLDRQDAFAGHDAFTARALEIITSTKVREAFDLSKEPDRVVARYGGGRFPHSAIKTLTYPWEARQFLLARRLVEAGVRVVTLRVGTWDHHSGANTDIFFALRGILPLLDRSLHALVSDLTERGLDRDVLVVVLGEFGRTPKVSRPGIGREHWAEAGCALFAGGGLRMGQVIGETDARAERARSGSISFQNVLATVYRVLGIDPGARLTDFNGRPQHLLEDFAPIAALGAP